MEIIQEIGSYAGLAAIVGLAVLSALYFSQARDVRRLRDWAGRAPERTSEPAAQPPRVVARPVPRPPGAQPTQAGVRPVAQAAAGPAAAASATGAAPAAAVGPAAATPAAARAAGESGSAGVSQDTMSHPPPLPPDGEAEDEDGRDLGDGLDGGDQAGAENGNRLGAESHPAGGIDTGDEQAVSGEDDDAWGDEGGAEPEGAREDEDDEEDAEPEDAWEDEDDGADVEPEDAAEDAYDGETGGRPAAVPPRPTRPIPPPPRTTPLPPRAAPVTAAGARPGAIAPGPRPATGRPILPPYERSRPGADEGSGFFYSRRRAALVIGLGVVVLAAATLGGLQLAGRDDGADQPSSDQVGASGQSQTPEGPDGESTPAVNPAEVTVAVLNGTTATGLAADFGDTVEREGYQLGNVTNSLDSERAESVVFYAPGAEAEAADVGRRLKITQREEIDPETQALAGDASVVVVLGADKA